MVVTENWFIGNYSAKPIVRNSAGSDPFFGFRCVYAQVLSRRNSSPTEAIDVITGEMVIESSN